MPLLIKQMSQVGENGTLLNLDAKPDIRSVVLEEMLHLLDQPQEIVSEQLTHLHLTWISKEWSTML